MQRLTERNLTAGGMGLALLLLSVVGIHSYQSINNLIKAEKWVKHTYEVIKNINAIASSLKDVERWQEEYSITNESIHLKDYQQASQDVKDEIKYLRPKMVWEEKERQQQFGRVQSLIPQRLVLMNQSINRRQKEQSNTGIQVSLANRGQTLQSEALQLLDLMEAQEQVELQQRLLASEHSSRNTFSLFIAGYIFSFGLLIAVYLLLQHQIYKRQRVEEELRRQVITLENIHDGIITTDLKGTIIDWNPAAERMFGYSKSEVLGKDLEILFADINDLTLIKKIINTAVNKGRWYGESPFTRKDKTKGFSEKIVVPLQNEQGEAIATIGVNRDITKRKQIEVALQESESTLRSFYDSALMMMGIIELFDNDILYISVNTTTAKFFGCTPAEMQKRFASQTGVSQQQLKEWIYYCQESKKICKPISFEYTDDDKTGLKWFSATVCAIATNQNGKSRFSYIVENITKRKQAEEQLKASFAEKDVLFKEIHHRVKNNLQIVHSLLRMQSRRTNDQQAVNALLESQSRIKSMALIHESLYCSTNLSKIDFSTYIPILINDLFSSYGINSNLITAQIKVKDIVLDIDTAIPCGLIINELVSNSLKYAFPSERQGVVEIDFYSEQKQINLIVEDNGIGISQQKLNNTQPLGLKLVKSLVSQLGGSIEASYINGTKYKISFQQ